MKNLWAKIKKTKHKGAFFVAAVQTWCAVNAFSNNDPMEGFLWSVIAMWTLLMRFVFLDWEVLQKKHLELLVTHGEFLDAHLALQKKYMDLQERLRDANKKLKTLMFIFNENTSTKESADGSRSRSSES